MKFKGPTLGLGVQLSWGTNGETRTARFTIEDRASRVQLIELELDAEQFATFMASGFVRCAGNFTAYPERLGKTLEHKRVELSASVFKGGDDAEAALEAWRLAEGWETATVSRNNRSQWIITGRRWVDPAPDEES